MPLHVTHSYGVGYLTVAQCAPRIDDRLFRLVKIFKLATARRLLGRTDEDEDAVHPAAVTLVRVFFQVLFVAHLLACFWHFLGDTWTDASDTWLHAHKIAETSTETRYWCSLYWSTATLTGVGYGDIYGTNPAEQLYCIFAELIGALVFGVIIGNVASLVKTMDRRAVLYSDTMIARRMHVHTQ